MAKEPVAVVRRVIPAGAEELFDAWLDAESLAAFMTPGPGMTATAKTDARVGGRFEIMMRGDGRELPHSGVYRVIDRPRKLVFTWQSDATNGKETVVTVDFVPRGKETEVVLTHTGLGTDDNAENHTMGWTAILDALQRLRQLEAGRGLRQSR